MCRIHQQKEPKHMESEQEQRENQNTAKGPKSGLDRIRFDRIGHMRGGRDTPIMMNRGERRERRRVGDREDWRTRGMRRDGGEKECKTSRRGRRVGESKQRRVSSHSGWARGICCHVICLGLEG